MLTERLRPAVRLANLRSGALAGVWGLGDQALISVTNFATMVLLARALTPHAFGQFVVVYTLLLFAATFQTALITRPHNVQASSLTGEEFRAYTSAAAALQLLLALGSGAIAIAVAVALAATGNSGSALLIALAAAVLCFELQEFVRQVEYTRGGLKHAFIYDVISYGGQLVLLLALGSLGRLTGVSAFYVLAVTSLVSAAYGFWRLRLIPAPPAWSRSWAFGKWLVADGLGQWLSMELFPLLTAALVGVNGLAAFKVVQNTVAPTHPLLNAYLAIAVPRAARAYNAGGHKALMAFLVPISIAMALPLVAYLGLISLLGSRLLALLYGPGQSQASVLIWLFSLTYLAQYAIRVQSVYLLAQGRSRAIFVARSFSIALTFTLGLGLIWFFDVYGALVGLLTSALGMVFVLGWCLWRGDVRQERRASSTESPPQLVTAGGES